MDSTLLLGKLYKTLGFVPPSERRERERLQAAVSARRAAVEAGEEAQDELAAGKSEFAEWCRRQGLDFPASADGSPWEDAWAYCETLEEFIHTHQKPVVEKARERLAAVAGDASRAGAARRTLAREQAVLDFADKELSKVWGLCHRPVIRGVKDDLAALKCRCGCGRMFESTRARRQAMRLHPACAARKRHATPETETYGDSLVERLPPAI